jgi:hypothetical protein
MMVRFAPRDLIMTHLVARPDERDRTAVAWRGAKPPDHWFTLDGR